MELGAKVRSIRKKKGMTAKELANLSNCTPSLISQIENDIANPSINTLKSISEALKVSLVDFFNDKSLNAEDTEDFVVRKGERKKFFSETEKAEIALLTPDNGENREIEMHLFTLKPGGKSDMLYTNEGTEVGYVLKGKIKIFLGEQEVELEEGDSIYFPGELAHGWENNGSEDAVTIWAVTPALLNNAEDVVAERISYAIKT